MPRKKPKWPKVARLGTVSTEVFDGLKFPGFGGLQGLKVLRGTKIARPPLIARFCGSRHMSRQAPAIGTYVIYDTFGVPTIGTHVIDDTFGEKQSGHKLGMGGRRDDGKEGR